MTKSRYYIATFPSCSMKSPLATLSGHILGVIDHIFEMLHMYADESYGQSPRQILHNMMQNNETTFSLRVPDKIPCASTSSQVQSSQESSSPLKGDLSSSCLTQKLPLEDKMKKASVSENLEKSTAEDSQVSVELCEKAEMLSSSAEEDKMDIATTKDAKMKINPKEERKEITESKDVKVLIKRNLDHIKSISIIRQSEFIGVEIYIDLSCMSDRSSPKKTEQDSSPSKKTNSPVKLDGKSRSPSSSLSKLIKSTDNPSIASESLQTVDYSDPNVLDFLAERLLSILSCRKTYMGKIHDCFKNFLRDVSDFHNTIKNLKYVVENLPMANESYLTPELEKFRKDLLDKAHQMSKKSRLLLKGVERNTCVLEKCLKEIDIFEKEHVPPLSTKDESILTVDNLKKIELRLKEICKEADGTVMLKGERRTILLNSSSNFEWLVKNFVKFLIITGILKPPLLDNSDWHG